MGSLIFFIACIFMFLIYTGLGVYFCVTKTPANFWSGEKIPPKAISDVKKYNRANGIMWIVYGILYLLPAIVSLTNIASAGIIVAVLTFGGVPILIFIYVKIIRPKYISNPDRLYD